MTYGGGITRDGLSRRSTSCSHARTHRHTHPTPPRMHSCTIQCPRAHTCSLLSNSLELTQLKSLFATSSLCSGVVIVIMMAVVIGVVVMVVMIASW